MTEESHIRVMIVDDHIIVREGLSTLLEAFPDLELVGEAASGEAAIQLCPRARPDVILMDLVMPGLSGIDTIRAIKQQFPDVQILVLTSYSDIDMVRGALQAGAIGYLLKNVSSPELAEAIRASHAAKPTLAPEATKIILTNMQRPSQVGSDLTERELEVLALIVRGYSNEEIAQTLDIAASTAKNHVSHILEKLDAPSRTAAATLAVQNNLVELP